MDELANPTRRCRSICHLEQGAPTLAELKYLLHPLTPDPEREMDIIFVHGLDGNIDTTWQSGPEPDNFWPKWLVDTLTFKIGVWSVGYPANSIRWRGPTLGFRQRALGVLDQLTVESLGDRPLIFIVHSFGGLVVKQILRAAFDRKDKAYKAILNQTKGIVFLATPHVGSRLANWVRCIPFLRAGAMLDDLEYKADQLLDLDTWFRNHCDQLRIKTRVYYETQGVRGFRVVDIISSDPGLPDVTPIPMDNDHISICKPKTKESPLYKGIVQFIKEARQIREEARRAEEEAEKARQAAEVARQAEEARQAEKVRQAAEAARQAEKVRQAAEAARQAEETRQTEEVRQAEEARQAAEKARQAAEEAYKAVLSKIEMYEGKSVDGGKFLYVNGLLWQWRLENPPNAYTRQRIQEAASLEKTAIERVFGQRLDTLHIVPDNPDYLGTHPSVKFSDLVTKDNVCKRLNKNKYSLVHLSSASYSHDDALKFEKEYAGSELGKDIKMAGAKLVVLPHCESLALCARVHYESGATVIAIPSLGSESRFDLWVKEFYKCLGEGRSVRQAHEAAGGVTGGVWVPLLGKGDIGFVKT
jgi:hypothetical protein